MPKEQQPYKQPETFLGQVVLWHDEIDSPEIAPAIVTAIGHEMLDLAVVVPNSAGFLPRNGVRHNSDPNREAIRNSGNGTWEHGKEIGELDGAFGQLSKLLDAQNKVIDELARGLAAQEAELANLRQEIEVFKAQIGVGKPAKAAK